MFQTTRRRLAFWYAAVTAVLLLLFATGIYFYVRTTLIDRVDDTLKHVVEVVERSLVVQPITPSENSYRVNVKASFRDSTNTVGDDHIDLEWFSPTGELLWSTLSESPDIPLNPSRSFETVHLSSEQLLRQATEPVKVGKQVLGYLRVSHPWFEVTKPIRQLLLDLVVGTSVMVTCVSTLAWLLSGVAIKPVRESYQSLKQFTADASHELRNPIATIQTNVQMALSYSETEPQLQQQQLQLIERLTQRLGRLVNDLLFLARSDSGTVETENQPVPLDALLMEVIEEQRTVARQKGVNLSLNLVEPPLNKPEQAEEVFTLHGDWDQLARLFTNLISNAVEHTAPSAESPSEETSVEVELQLLKRSTASQLQVKVQDTGEGIPETGLSHLFDRFYRVDPYRSNDQGSSTSIGLGLAIAQAIVENHHGHISVESVLHQGTTFTVTLPAAKSE